MCHGCNKCASHALPALPTVILASNSQPEGPCECRQVAALVPVKQGDGSCWCQSSPLCRPCVCYARWVPPSVQATHCSASMP